VLGEIPAVTDIDSEKYPGLTANSYRLEKVNWSSLNRIKESQTHTEK